MKKIGLKLFAIVFALLSISTFLSCSDNNEIVGTSEVAFEITDAPCDDSNINGVFVTIAEIKVDGKKINGFTKQTIDLKAYADGKTKLLGVSEIDARTYNNLTLVLDLDADESGVFPGCYVKTTGNEKIQLASTASGKLDVVVNKSWKVVHNTRNRMVIDFDLRKAIQYSTDSEVKYSFVAQQKLNNAVRLLSRAEAGSISGTFSGDADADMIVVYAYKKGTFNAETEMREASGEIMFSNAVSSALVRPNLTTNVYTLAFLEEGEYELHFVGYNRDATNGRFTVASVINASSTAEGSVGDFVTVKAGLFINVFSSVGGM